MNLLPKKKSIKIIKKRCIICKNKLKFFEANLCSCKENVCIKHMQKSKHSCIEGKKYVKLEKVVSPKVVKI